MSQVPNPHNGGVQEGPPQPHAPHVQMNAGQGQPVQNAQTPQGKVLGFAETPLPSQRPPSREHILQRTPSFELGMDINDEPSSYLNPSEHRPTPEHLQNIMRPYYNQLEPEYHRSQPLVNAQSYSDISAGSARFSSHSYGPPKMYRDNRELCDDPHVPQQESPPPKVLIIKRRCQHDDTPIPTTLFVFVVFVLNVVFLCSLTYRFFQDGQRYRHY